MHHNATKKAVKAVEKEEQKREKTERDKEAIKEVMRKVCEEEEKKMREEVGKKCATANPFELKRYMPICHTIWPWQNFGRRRRS